MTGYSRYILVIEVIFYTIYLLNKILFFKLNLYSSAKRISGFFDFSFKKLASPILLRNWTWIWSFVKTLLLWFCSCSRLLVAEIMVPVSPSKWWKQGTGVWFLRWWLSSSVFAPSSSQERQNKYLLQP